MERTIDMDAIVGHITAAGHFAYVEQTGGGVATIYASSVARPEGGPLATVSSTDGEYRYEAIAGPGWFEGPGWTNARAAINDFYIGADDDGEGPYYTARDTDDERTIAARIISTLEARRASRFQGPGWDYAPGEPRVDTTDRASIIRWLTWNDPNGSYTDAACVVEGIEPLTLDMARDALVNAVHESTGDVVTV